MRGKRKGSDLFLMLAGAHLDRLGWKTLAGERGALSIAYAMIAIVILFVMSNVLLSTVGGDARSSSSRLLQARVFYAAESGLELGLRDLKDGGTGELSGIEIGGISVSTHIVCDTLLVSTASANGLSRTLQIGFRRRTLPDAFYYAVSSFQSNKQLKFQGPHPKGLDGDVFSYTTKTVRFGDGLVFGDVTLHIPSGTNVENKGGYTFDVEYFDPDSKPLNFPSLSTSYYDSYINNVKGYANRDDDIEDCHLDLTTLPDGVYYTDDDLEIENSTITGPGILASEEDIKIEDNSKISGNVQIISGEKVEIKDGSSVSGLGSIIYGHEGVKIRGHFTSVEGSILSPEEVEIDCASKEAERGNIIGIIYSGDKAKIRHAKIYGSIVAQYYNGNEIHCTYVIFGESYLPSTAPPGFTVSSSPFQIVSGSWRQQ